MRLYVFSFALAASLLIAGVVAFVYSPNAITIYFIEQTENPVPNRFLNNINTNRYLPLFKRSPKAIAMDTTNFKADDALHKILRKIAICR